MKNLFGEYIITPELIAEELINSCSEETAIRPVKDTKQGFELYVNEGVAKTNRKGYHSDTGFYSIHRDGLCLYVGKSETSIGMRIARFVKEVNGKSRFDENHPAAKKYKTMWGSDLAGVTVKIYPCDIQSYVEHKQIETHMIRLLNPLLNVKSR